MSHELMLSLPIDPITQDVVQHPVITTCCATTFSEHSLRNLVEYAKKKNKLVRCPTCSKEYSYKKKWFVPNLALRDLMHEEPVTFETAGFESDEEDEPSQPIQTDPIFEILNELFSEIIILKLEEGPGFLQLLEINNGEPTLDEEESITVLEFFGQLYPNHAGVISGLGYDLYRQVRGIHYYVMEDELTNDDREQLDQDIREEENKSGNYEDGMLRARVQTWFPKRGYGFVKIWPEEEKAFLHASVLKKGGYPQVLKKGMSMDVRIEQVVGQKYPTVTKVNLL